MKKLLAFLLVTTIFTAIAILTWQRLQVHLSKPQPLEIAFLDIGQGDATLITFPDMQQMLVDCAIDARVLEALGRNMPFWDWTIEHLVITHPDLDHYGGCIDVIERFHVKHIYHTGVAKENRFHQALEERLGAHQSVRVLDEQHRWQFASTTVQTLYPLQRLSEKQQEPNNTSVVLLLEHAGKTVLLTADAEEEQEQWLLEQYGQQLDVDVLKVGHHGSHTSSIKPFLEATTPQHAIISAGYENSYGHPHLSVIRRLERINSQIWRTDLHGDILLTITDSDIYVGADYSPGFDCVYARSATRCAR